MHPGPTNGDEPERFRKGLTRHQALVLLRQDARRTAFAVAECVEVVLSQPQFDALVSFTFNLGVGAFESSTLLRRLNAGEFDAVPVELGRWVRADGRILPGLVRRRAAEARLFEEGAYT